MKLVEINREKPTGFENVKEVIKVRKPIMKDLVDVDLTTPKLQMEGMLILLSRVTPLSLDELKNLDFQEYEKLSDELGKYLNRG